MKLSPLDCLFLGIDSVESPAHVGAVMIYEIPKGYKGNFVRDLKDKLLKNREVVFPFSHRLKPQGIIPKWPEWEPCTNMDLDWHVRHNGLPHPGTREDLNALIARLHTRQLDRARPLWEFYLIEGLEGNRFAVYQKMHHAMVDGMGGIEMMDSVLSLKPDQKHIRAPWAPVIKRGKKKEKAGLYKQMMKSTRRAIKQAIAVPQAMNAVLAPAVGLKKTKAGVAFKSKLSPINVHVTAARTFAVGTFEMGQTKAISKALDATVNDLFLTACSGALAKWHKRMKKPLDENFTAGLPVALAREGESNAITTILVNLHPEITNTEKRLRAIQESTQAAKDDLAELSRQTIDTMTILGWGAQIGLAEFGLAEKMPPASNLIISNVPGLREDRYFGGARLEGMYPLSVLMQAQGLNITIMSHADKLHFCLLSTPEIMPDIQRVADEIVDEARALRALAEKKSGRAIKIVPGANKKVTARKKAVRKSVTKKSAARRKPKTTAAE